MNKKHLFSLALVAVMAVAVTTPTFADDGRNNNDNNGRGPQGMMRGRMMGELKDDIRLGVMPSIAGKVTAVSGNTITITHGGSRGSATSTSVTTFTIDASTSVVFKGNATSTVSSIVVGDNIFVQGTVNGSSVVATKIFDGPMMQRMGERREDRKASSTQPVFQGNGQPIVAGKVTSVGTSTISITNASNVNFTVDTTNAKIQLKGNVTGSISNIALGDHVVVQGTVNGSSVVASTILDQKDQSGNTNNNGGNGDNGNHFGFFRGIGNFFKNLFGF